MQSVNRNRPWARITMVGDFWGIHPHPSPPAAAPPSPVKGEGLSVRLSRLLCSSVSAIVRAFPLTGGRWPQARGGREAPPQAVTDEGEDKMNVGVTPKETWLPN